MKLLVTGGRDFDDVFVVENVLYNVHSQEPITVLINGGATGADSLCRRWAITNGIEVIDCPADWKKHGRAAGPIRNREMLTLKPDVLLAFPGGRGTDNMVKQATESGLRVIFAVDVYMKK